MDYQLAQTYNLMRFESNRLRSFQMNPPWPKDNVDIKKLAKAGFFYVFSGDRVHCAFCRGEVCNWERDDDPMSEHARHFITCPFIMGGEVGNVPLGDDPIPGPKRPRAYDVCGPYPSFPPNDPRSLEERYVDTHPWSDNSGSNNNLETNNLYIEEGSNSHPSYLNPSSEDDTVSSIASTASNPSSSIISTSNTQNPQPITTSSVHTVEPSLFSQPLQESYAHGAESYTMESFANQFSVTNDPPPQAYQLNGICKICYTNSIELVFLPCGHSVSCRSCSSRLGNCPFCRERITSRIRTYLV